MNKPRTPFFMCFSWAPNPLAFDFTMSFCEERRHVLRQLVAYLVDTKGALAKELTFKGTSK